MVKGSDGANGDVVATANQLVVDDVLHIMGLLILPNKRGCSVSKTHVLEIVFVGCPDELTARQVILTS